MSIIAKFRGMINSMHVVHAVDCGVQLGLFSRLASNKSPISVRSFVKQTEYPSRYLVPWLRVMQSAGIVNIDSAERITFDAEWAEALTDTTSTKYIGQLANCHLGIATTYRRFPALFRSDGELPPTQFDKSLIAAIASDGVRFANYFVHSVLGNIPQLNQLLVNGGIVYDVGCGGGDFLLHLARYFPQSEFIGIDPLPLAIQLSQDKVDEAARSGQQRCVSFREMCATQLPANVADCVTCTEVFHEVAPHKRKAAMAAIYRSLKPGGMLFLMDVLSPQKPSDYDRPEFALSSLIQFFEAPWGSNLMSCNELESLLFNAGFSSHKDVIAEDDVAAFYAIK